METGARCSRDTSAKRAAKIRQDWRRLGGRALTGNTARGTQLKLVCDRHERIDQFHACTFEIGGIARYHCQIVHQADGRDLFIEFVSGSRDP